MVHEGYVGNLLRKVSKHCTCMYCFAHLHKLATAYLSSLLSASCWQSNSLSTVGTRPFEQAKHLLKPLHNFVVILMFRPNDLNIHHRQCSSPFSSNCFKWRNFYCTKGGKFLEYNTSQFFVTARWFKVITMVMMVQYKLNLVRTGPALNCVAASWHWMLTVVLESVSSHSTPPVNCLGHPTL